MPKIEQYTRQLTEIGKYGTRASPEAFGAGIGRQLQGLGRELDVAAQRFREVQEKQERSDYIEKLGYFELENLKRNQELSKSEFEEGADIPQVYVGDFEERAAAFEAQVPQSMKDNWAVDSARMRIGYAKSGFEEQIRRRGLKDKLRYENSYQNGMNRISIDHTQAGAVEAELTGIINNSALGPEERAFALDGIKDDVRTAEALSYLEKHPKAFIDEARGGKWNDTKDVGKLISIAEAEINGQNAELKNDYKRDFADYQEAMKLGRDIPDNEIDTMINRAEALELDGHVETLETYKTVKGDVEAFSKLSAKLQQEEIQRLETSGKIDSVDNARLGAYRDVLEAKKALINQGNGFKYYAENNIIKDTEPLDYSNPETLAAEIEKRRASISVIQDFDGVTLPLLQPEEVDQLIDLYDRGSTQEVSAILTTLSAGLTEEELAMTGEAIAAKNGALGIAMAVGNPIVTQRILEGSKLKGEVSAKDVREEAREIIGELGIPGDVLDDTYGAIYAYYKDAANKRRDISDVVNEGYVKEAITNIVGHIVDIDTRPGVGSNSQKTISYKDSNGAWVEESQLQDTFQDYTLNDLVAINRELPYGFSGEQYQTYSDLSLIKKIGVVTKVEGSKYIIVFPDTQEYLTDKNGNPYIIDAEALYKQIRSRQRK